MQAFTVLLQFTTATLLWIAVECLLVGIEPVAPARELVEVALLVALVIVVQHF